MKVEAAWKFVDPILDYLEELATDVNIYGYSSGVLGAQFRWTYWKAN